MGLYGYQQASKYGITLLGTEAMNELFQRAGQPAFMHAVAQAVYAEANIIMLRSKEIVPLDDGPLRASGTVEMPVIEGVMWSITLGFGGAAFMYALEQHENLLFRHKPGRTAKYLELPIKQRLPILEKAVAVRVESYLTDGLPSG